MTDFDGNDIQLSKGKVKKIGRKHNDRISDDAAIVVAYDAERRINEHFKLAAELAAHDGRATVMEKDARLAGEILRGEI